MASRRQPVTEHPAIAAATEAGEPSAAFKFSYVSDTYGKGGQHTNGPDYGLLRCEHLPTQTAVEIHTHPARGQHRARTLALTLCQMAVAEIMPTPRSTK